MSFENNVTTKEQAENQQTYKKHTIHMAFDILFLLLWKCYCTFDL